MKKQKAKETAQQGRVLRFPRQDSSSSRKSSTEASVASSSAQQGDVILRRSELPAGAKQGSKNSLVLAEGEVTGHAHRIEQLGSELFDFEGRTFIKLIKPATLRHEEHKPITLSPGVWEVGRVQEYDYISLMVRSVAD